MAMLFLPADRQYAFQYLFYNCTAITDASELLLPATTLADYCYGDMFHGCTSLTAVPELPATTLASRCYYYMFYGCTGIKLSTTGNGITWSIPSNATVGSGSLTSMFANTGGTSTGTPIKGKVYYITSAVLSMSAPSYNSPISFAVPSYNAPMSSLESLLGGDTTTDGIYIIPVQQFSEYTITAGKTDGVPKYIQASKTVYIGEEDVTETIYLKKIVPITIIVKDYFTDEEIVGAEIVGIHELSVYDDLAGITNIHGEVTLDNSANNESYTITVTATSYIDVSQKITVDEANNTVIIKLKPIPKLYVTVEDLDGTVEDATVVCNGQIQTTNEYGITMFDGLTYQSYTVTASKDEYKNISSEVIITQKENYLTIQMKPEATDVDISIEANEIATDIYKRETIIVAATVTGDAITDCTDELPITVTMTAKQNETVWSTQSKTIVCPHGETNLVWFTVTLPAEGYGSPASVEFNFTATVADGMVDTDESNNTDTVPYEIGEISERSSPETKFELNAPNTFYYDKRTESTATKYTWSVWEWEDGDFAKKTYSAGLDIDVNLTPDETATWKQKKNILSDIWTTRSGCGLNTDMTLTLTDTSSINADAFAGTAMIDVYYPEYNYTSDTDKTDTLERKSESVTGTEDIEYSSEYTFKVDENSISKNEMHKTPMWFPDGTYTPEYVIYGLWTPMGELTATVHGEIEIEGSFYDDWYTRRG